MGNHVGNHSVVALAYDQLCTFEMGCVIEIFGLPRPEINVPWYDFAICAIERGPIRAAGGLIFKAPLAPKMLETADTIIIPGWRDLDSPVPVALIKRLRAAHARGARICSICSGVFVLAAAGLLDGKLATTHWKHIDQFSSRYPKIQIEANALYVDAGQIVTSAGSAAGLDMMLHLIRCDHGTKIANLVARRLVIPPHRSGGQAQFNSKPLQHEAGRLSRLMDWMRAHLTEAHTLASMAKRALMSTRSLQRTFQEATGLTPMEWLVRERIGMAREMLESSETQVSEVARRAGFGSEESFRKHFRTLVGTSPSAYRNQFCGMASGEWADVDRQGKRKVGASRYSVSS
jgi:AraC family transcriptional regulator, transcriptional activator FtrA